MSQLFALVPALLIHPSAHRRFLLVCALDPFVNPTEPRLDACAIGTKFEERSADLHRAGKKIRRRRLLRVIKKPLPIGAWRFADRHMHHVEVFTQLLHRHRRSRASYALESGQRALLVFWLKLVGLLCFVDVHELGVDHVALAGFCAALLRTARCSVARGPR